MSMALLEKMAPVLLYVESVDPTEANCPLISRKESFTLKFKMTVDVLFKMKIIADISLKSLLRESNFFLLSTTIILKHTSLNVFLKMKT